MGGEDAEQTWDAQSGENAIIVQPGNQWVETQNTATGPHVKNEDLNDSTPWEYLIEYDELDNQNSDEGLYFGNQMGRQPAWIQSEELPFKHARLILQLEDASLPFFVNFGCGCAYFFLDEKGESGKFCWQC